MIINYQIFIESINFYKILSELIKFTDVFIYSLIKTKMNTKL